MVAASASTGVNSRNIDNTDELADLPVVSFMTKEEANAELNLIDLGMQQLKAKELDLRARIYNFDVRRGWEVLGYTSLLDLWRDRFGEKSQFYRELDAAHIEASMGVEIGTHRESHLRPLTGLTGEQCSQILNAVQQKGKVTAKAIEQELDEQMPSIEEIHGIFANYGRIDTSVRSTKRPNAFRVIRDVKSSPDELFFQGRKEAWAFINNEEKYDRVAAAIEEYGAYNPEQVPRSCLNCIHRNITSVNDKPNVYCARKRTDIELSDVEAAAEGTCWTSEVLASSEDPQERLEAVEAQLQSIQGVHTKYAIDNGELVEAVICHVVLAVASASGVRYVQVPYSELEKKVLL